MLKKISIGALVGVLGVLVASLAWANPVADTTLSLEAKPTSTKGGTSDKPRKQGLSVTFTGGTKSGTGQPSNTTQIEFTLPAEWKINTKKWPQAATCDGTKADSDKSLCPKGSKVGSGSSQAKAANGAITQNLAVTAYVLEGGNLGFFVEGSTPVEVAAMLKGRIKGRKLTVPIPSNIQEPAPGVLTGITLLKTSLGGSIKNKGTNVNLLESVGCKNKKWNFNSKFVYRDGSLTDGDDAKCVK
ncbi:MAG: hypothetical protein H0V29_04045 [Thermoleophilaceae bacterium]|nr:hypothetical protein [Thermoleophilaceae bacterium]